MFPVRFSLKYALSGSLFLTAICPKTIAWQHPTALVRKRPPGLTKHVLTVRNPFEEILGSAAPSSLPPVQKRKAQHKFLQHDEARTDLDHQCWAPGSTDSMTGLSANCHSFQNHYIFNSKNIKSCNGNCGKFLGIPEGNYSCNCILLDKEGNCNCNAISSEDPWKL